MESVYEANEFVVALAILALMVIANETGFRLGRRSGETGRTRHKISTLDG